MRKLFYMAGLCFIMMFTSNSASVAPASFQTHSIEEKIAQIREYEYQQKHAKKKQILFHFSINLKKEKEIFEKIDEIALDLSIEPEWLLMTICRESRANPKAVNTFTKATGIIQWLPSTAKDLGTSIYEIHNMSFVDQLDLVKKYVNRVNRGKQINSYEDLYLTVFYPRAVGKADDYVIGNVNSLIVKYNYPMSKNGMITVADAKAFARVRI